MQRVNVWSSEVRLIWTHVVFSCSKSVCGLRVLGIVITVTFQVI